MARKTVEIAALIEAVNNRNRGSRCVPEMRRGWNTLLESVLMSAGYSADYALLTKDEVPENQLPGIHSYQRGSTLIKETDGTRRRYFFPGCSTTVKHRPESKS